MSLRAFHLFFIAVSILLALGFGVWELRSFARQGLPSDLVLGLLSLAAVVGLVLYLRAVLRKFRNLDNP